MTHYIKKPIKKPSPPKGKKEATRSPTVSPLPAAAWPFPTDMRLNRVVGSHPNQQQRTKEKTMPKATVAIAGFFPKTVDWFLNVNAHPETGDYILFMRNPATGGMGFRMGRFDALSDHFHALQDVDDQTGFDGWEVIAYTKGLDAKDFADLYEEYEQALDNAE